MDGIGDRIYEVRAALGPNRRKPLPQREFAALLNAAARAMGLDARYDSSVVTRLETEQRQASRADVAAVAAVDPLRRGLLWLGWSPAILAYVGAAAASVVVDDDGIPEAVRDLPRITPVDRARPLTDAVVDELQREAAGAPPARKAATAKARRRK